MVRILAKGDMFLTPSVPTFAVASTNTSKGEKTLAAEGKRGQSMVAPGDKVELHLVATIILPAFQH